MASGSALATISCEELNKNRDLFCQAVGFFSGNVKSYAKWFEIPEVKKNPETYTSYKVVYRFLPKDLNESVKEIVVWKRFRDFKELNQFMSHLHSSLHRRDKFPEFIKSKFFGRFEDKVIEERREASLRLLQFVGSQSHLYKSEKFVQFFSVNKCRESLQRGPESSNLGHFSSPSAYFADHQTSESLTGQILQPISPTTNSPALTDQNRIIQQLRANTNKLKELIVDIESYIKSSPSNDITIEYLTNVKKLLNLAVNKLGSIMNDKTSPMLFDANKHLKPALDCLSEIESKRCSPSSLSYIKNVYLKINRLINDDFRPIKTPVDERNKMPVEDTPNDWIISDFNLVSHDFNTELSFISGNLLDLGANYKLVRLITDRCVLIQLKNDHQDDGYYLLKRLRKCFNPSLNMKSLVPFKNRIPWSSQLLKYFESEDTIFLLVEYHKFGPLFPYLSLIRDTIDLFPSNLPQLYSLMVAGLSSSTHGPRNLMRAVTDSTGLNLKRARLRLSHSFSGVSSLYAASAPKLETQRDGEKRRTQSHSQSIKLMTLSAQETLTSKEIDSPFGLSPSFDSVPSSSSSSSLGEEDTSQSRKSEIEFMGPSRVVFKATMSPKSTTDEERPSITSPSSKLDTTSRKYQRQVKLWLAQLLVAFRNLHEMGIIRKDLMTDDILITRTGDIALTYSSKWNLVDEKVNQKAIEHFYAAPELTGMVKNEISSACDWWSFGVIAYEIMSGSKFYDFHERYELYVDKINFTDDFETESGKDLIKKLLRSNPAKRLSREKIQQHAYFSDIDWISLEESFWSK